MRRLITFLSAAAVAACLAGAPAVAVAAAQNQVVSDCASNGHLTRTYSAAQLRAALTSMPVTVKEYTSCYDIIQAALLKEIGQNGKGNGSGSGSGGSSFPTVLVIILVLLALAAVTFGALAIRRRGAGGPAGGDATGGGDGTDGGDRTERGDRTEGGDE